MRDWEHDEFGTSLDGWETTQRAPIVIVEGVTCTRRQAADRLAFSVWVDAPSDVRLARGIERDGGTHRHLWLRWMSEEQTFFNADRTRSRADLRVLGATDVPHDPETELVAEDT